MFYYETLFFACITNCNLISPISLWSLSFKTIIEIDVSNLFYKSLFNAFKKYCFFNEITVQNRKQMYFKKYENID